jgi:hypothetical protein
MNRVVVCILIYGSNNYFKAGIQAALSVLEFSDFDLFLAFGPNRDPPLGNESRIRHYQLQIERSPGNRAQPFLLKFQALQACLSNTQHSWLMLLDADAVLVRPITKEMISQALPKSGLGMVEQTTILGSGVGREDFHNHYNQYSLAWLAPGADPPKQSRFRYYNSGLVLSRRNELQAFIDWALTTFDQHPGNHLVGQHMIGDQDYFQFWANNLRPNNCNKLPWYWNHCEHWDKGFPRKGAYVVHFSNFCLEPTPWQLLRMRLIRHNAWRWERVVHWLEKSDYKPLNTIIGLLI